MLVNRIAVTIFISTLSGLFITGAFSRAGETLYNGIVLSAQWPPKPKDYFTAQDVKPPYLKSPPSVIPIDVGRQLFVDDFLIEKTTLKRAYHMAEFYKGNPVLKPDKPWEVRKDLPFAAPVSDGVWYDPTDKTFKMWYTAGYGYLTGYAKSTDGIHWKKPAISDRSSDRPKGSNILQLSPVGRNSGTVWIDLEAKDPKQRYKMVRFHLGLETRVSADGIHWSERIWHNTRHNRKSIGFQDRSTAFYNPFRKIWVISGRKHQRGRVRGYQEVQNFHDPSWTAGMNASKWIRADKLDAVRKDTEGRYLPDLYNLDCIPYESLIIGLFTVHARDADKEKKRPKINYVAAGFTRDGFYWDRPDRRAFMNVSEDPKAWNYGNVQSANALLVMGDKLYFYCAGRNGGKNLDAEASTGLAFLRRDGFASMDGNGTLTTRPVTFKGKYLFVNVDCPEGELKVEMLSERGGAIGSFTRSNCVAVKADSTIQAVTWKGGDLSRLAGQKVRFKFHLKSGKLYSFWVSPDKSGASHGCVGTGGPGFTSNRDTRGKAAYKP